MPTFLHNPIDGPDMRFFYLTLRRNLRGSISGDEFENSMSLSVSSHLVHVLSFVGGLKALYIRTSESARMT